jgi:hypothetical protein
MNLSVFSLGFSFSGLPQGLLLLKLSSLQSQSCFAKKSDFTQLGNASFNLCILYARGAVLFHR